MSRYLFVRAETRMGDVLFNVDRIESIESYEVLTGKKRCFVRTTSGYTHEVKMSADAFATDLVNAVRAEE